MKAKSDSFATYAHDQETPRLEKKIKGESHDLSDSMPKNKTRMSPKSRSRTKNDDAATETDYGGPVTRNARTKYQGQFCAEHQNGSKDGDGNDNDKNSRHSPFHLFKELRATRQLWRRKAAEASDDSDSCV